MATANEITEAIIGAAIKVHKALGPGLLHPAYKACLAYELRKRGVRVERDLPVPVVYEEVKLDCGFLADLIVEDRVVVAVRTKDCLQPLDEAQLLSHLRLLKLSVGLLINFNVLVLKDGIKRMVNDYKGD